MQTIMSTKVSTEWISHKERKEHEAVEPRLVFASFASIVANIPAILGDSPKRISHKERKEHKVVVNRPGFASFAPFVANTPAFLGDRSEEMSHKERKEHKAVQPRLVFASFASFVANTWAACRHRPAAASDDHHDRQILTPVNCILKSSVTVNLMWPRVWWRPPGERDCSSPSSGSETCAIQS